RLGLPTQRLLLAEAGIGGLAATEELARAGLLDVPRRVGEHGVEAWLGAGEDLAKLERPVEEAQLVAQALHDLAGGFAGGVEIERRGGAGEEVGGPKPDGAPCVVVLA